MELEKAGIKANGTSYTKYRGELFESATTTNENRAGRSYERITRRVNCNDHSLD